MEGDLGAAADLEHDDVVHLAHAGLAQRGRIGALPHRLRFLRLDMDHHVGSGHGFLYRPLDGVRRRVPLLDRGAVRNPDDDVGEVAPGRPPHPEPAQLHSGLELLDRRERRLLRRRRRTVHEHVDVPLNHPGGCGEDEHADEERRDRVPLGVAGARGEQPDEDGERAREVAAEMEDVHGERRALVAACRPEGHVRSAHVHGDDDSDDTERERVDVHLVPALDKTEDRARRDDERGDDEDRGLGERAQVLRLAVPVRVADVGRPACDPDREEGQEGGDEVRSRVSRLREKAEAARVDSRHELERDEHERREHRDESGPTLGRHAVSVAPLVAILWPWLTPRPRKAPTRSSVRIAARPSRPSS